MEFNSLFKKQTIKCNCKFHCYLISQGWEITTASAKLAECQETILNLGKQLKALASPREAAILDNMFSTTSATPISTNDKKINKRSSLRDRMLAEDDTKAKVLKPPKLEETTSSVDEQKPSILHPGGHNVMHTSNVPVHTPEASRGSDCKTSNNAFGTLAIVPSKKQGGFALLKRLFLRRKKTSSQKPRSLTKV